MREWIDVVTGFQVLEEKWVKPHTAIQTLAAIVIAAAVSACKPSDYALEAQAKEWAAETLRDPQSVQFRNLEVKRTSDNEAYVCGEINGTTVSGGYSGFREFVVSLYAPDVSFNDALARTSLPAKAKGVLNPGPLAGVVHFRPVGDESDIRGPMHRVSVSDQAFEAEWKTDCGKLFLSPK